MTEPLARAPEPPEKVLADAMVEVMSRPEYVPPSAAPERFARQLLRELTGAGYRVVPESPARPSPEEFEAMTDEQFTAYIHAIGFDADIDASLAEVRAGKVPVWTKFRGKRAVPESEVGLDAARLGRVLGTREMFKWIVLLRKSDAVGDRLSPGFARDFARALADEYADRYEPAARLSDPSR